VGEWVSRSDEFKLLVIETAAAELFGLCVYLCQCMEYGVCEERKMPTLSHSKEERGIKII